MGIVRHWKPGLSIDPTYCLTRATGDRTVSEPGAVEVMINVTVVLAGRSVSAEAVTVAAPAGFVVNGDAVSNENRWPAGWLANE